MRFFINTTFLIIYFFLLVVYVILKNRVAFLLIIYDKLEKYGNIGYTIKRWRECVKFYNK